MDPEKELEKGKAALAELEKILIEQNVPYVVHVERLALLKYLHTRLEILAKTERASQE